MSRFEQLQSGYRDATAANHRYWSQMHQVIRDLPKAFSEYLGVEPSQIVSLQGQNIPVVSIGSSDDKNPFINWQVEKLPRDSLAIEFALRLAFGDQANSKPSPTYVIHLSIEGVGEGLFTIKEKGPDEAEFRGPIFTALFEEIFRRALSTLKS